MSTPTPYEIPLSSYPQQFGIQLGGVGYVLRLTWCWPIQVWMLDIYNGTTLVPMLQGRPLVTGADLLEQFAYMGINGQLVVQTDHDTLAMPTFSNLGSLSHLYFVVME